MYLGLALGIGRGTDTLPDAPTLPDLPEGFAYVVDGDSGTDYVVDGDGAYVIQEIA
jgi:hypothetical protein